MSRRRTIHIHDVFALLETEYPEALARQRLPATTILRCFAKGLPSVNMRIRRPEVRPF